MTREKAIEMMLNEHIRGLRPIRWTITEKEGGFELSEQRKPWLDITPEQLDGVIDLIMRKELTTDEAMNYLENCFS